MVDSPNGLSFNNLFNPKGGMFGCGSAATGESEHDGGPVDLGSHYTDTVEITSKPDAEIKEAVTDTGLPDPCDADNDGFLLAPYCGEGPYDCNDLNDKAFPGADEVPCNGVDEDCDGKDLTDLDGDGVDGCFNSEPKDCDEKDKTIFPGAQEKTCDHIDQNCNGNNDEDWDCDGFTIDDGDCDDGNSQINPGAKDKICDTDLNCDGKIDEKDVDKDGYGACTWSDPFDCDDNNVNVNPGAEEIPCNDLDENCDGKPTDNCVPCIDNDKDGFGENCPAGPDCDDTNPLINPLMPEVCNGADDNCNNQIDENIPSLATYSGDPEKIGKGICKEEIKVCENGFWVITQPESLPQTEISCNMADENCDGIDSGTWGIINEEIKLDGNGVRPDIVWSGTEYGLCWQSTQNSSINIFFSRIDINGIQIGIPMQISDNTSYYGGGGFSPAFSTLKWTGNKYALTWADNQTGNNEVFFTLLDSNGLKFLENIQITNSQTSSTIVPSLSWTGQFFGLCWSDYFANTSFTQIDNQGNKIMQDINILGDNAGSYPSLLWNGNGYGLVWACGPSMQDIYFTRLNNSGDQIGENTFINSADFPLDADSALMWTGNEYGITWVDEMASKIYFVRLDKEGNKIGDNEQVSDELAEPSYGSCDAPSIVWTGNGSAIVWADYRAVGYSEIYFTLLDKNGKKILNDVKITTSQTYNSHCSEITWTGQEFGITWEHGNDILFARIGCQ